MTGPGEYADGVPVVAGLPALQIALSYAAKAAACFRMGLVRLGDDAMLSASELAVAAFGAGSAGAIALATVLDAVERAGDEAAMSAELDAILAGGDAG